MCIYKITNKINGKTYIGCIKNYKERVKYHTTRYDKKKEWHKPLYQAMRKYGVENFSFELLQEEPDTEKAYALESKMIDLNNSLTTGNGYNVSPGVHYWNVPSEDNNTAVLTRDEAQSIVNRRIAGEKSSVVYKDFKDKITWSGFQRIWVGETWKTLEGQDNIEIIKGNSKLSLAEVREIKKAFKEGKTPKQVSQMFGICYHTAYNIKVGISYKNIAA